ncbi:MAG TPA: Rieske 2Fe-2S domain-containing protein [Candidatus Tectomicrobia bacterium]|nr:Rieske 2Fe-2S domain-containing protein [Candidatus Tectomicrobia bacterium]
MPEARAGALAERASRAIERQDWLAPTEEALQRGIAAAFRAGGAVGQRIKDVLHGTWLGHPLHPVLTDVPIGAWSTAVVIDLLDRAPRARWGVRRGLQQRADDAIAVGIAGAAGAALAGMTDWQHTSGPARRTGLVHAALNTLALTLYVSSLAQRRRGRRAAGRRLAYAGYGILLASAYLGGRLVYHHRVGVDRADRDARPLAFARAVRDVDLAEGQPRRVEVDGIRVLLVRRGGQVYALGEVCGHMAGPLADGELVDDSIVCPWHGSRFALEDGRVLNGPATMPQPCFETRLRDGWIEIRAAPDVRDAAA